MSGLHFFLLIFNIMSALACLAWTAMNDDTYWAGVGWRGSSMLIFGANIVCITVIALKDIH